MYIEKVSQLGSWGSHRPHWVRMHIILVSLFRSSKMISQMIGRKQNSKSLLRKMPNFSLLAPLVLILRNKNVNKNNQCKSPNLSMICVYLSTKFCFGRKREKSLEPHHFEGVKEENTTFLVSSFPNIFLRVSPNKMHAVCFSAENLYQNTACNGRIASSPCLIKQIIINNFLS